MLKNFHEMFGLIRLTGGRSHPQRDAGLRYRLPLLIDRIIRPGMVNIKVMRQWGAWMACLTLWL
jgi:hypothetical protein